MDFVDFVDFRLEILSRTPMQLHTAEFSYVITSRMLITPWPSGLKLSGMLSPFSTSRLAVRFSNVPEGMPYRSRPRSVFAESLGIHDFYDTGDGCWVYVRVRMSVSVGKGIAGSCERNRLSLNVIWTPGLDFLQVK